MNSYTAQSQAQKGFKTFILTLSVSLIVFSVLYYFISDAQVVDDTEVLSDTAEYQTSTDTQESAFGKLAAEKVDVSNRAVLAGTDVNTSGDMGEDTTDTTVTTTTADTTVTESTTAVPDGGITQLTWGFLISLFAFTFGFIVITQNPRKLAINSFEKKMLED